MPTALCLTSSLEVLKVSMINQPFGDADPAHFTVLVDPDLPDGAETLDENGDPRVLGFAKIADIGSNTVRNATLAEIATFAPAWEDFERDLDAQRARDMADVDPVFRKIVAALMKMIIQQFNQTNALVNALGLQFEQWKTEGGTAGNLAQVQAILNGLPDLNFNLNDDITLAQAVNQLKSLVSRDE